jgi:hypothetical protein
MELIAGGLRASVLVCCRVLFALGLPFISDRGVPANYPNASYKCGFLITQFGGEGGGSPCRAVQAHIVDLGVIITPHPILSLFFGGVYPCRTHAPISALRPIYRV